ncbi:MAG: hypothetical protein O9327_10520 [Polaromonas sp.]|nr:hypothetical protein [Polaromonas sp.]
MDHKDHPDASNPWAQTHHRGRARLGALGAITHEVDAASKAWVRAGFEASQWERLEDRGVSCFVILGSVTNLPDLTSPTFGFMRLDRAFFERLAHAMASCPKTDGMVALKMRPDDFQMNSGASADEWNMTLEVERSSNTGSLVLARLSGRRRGAVLLSADIVAADLMALAHQLTASSHDEPKLTSSFSDVDNTLIALKDVARSGLAFEGVVHGLADPSRVKGDDISHLLVPSKIGDMDDPALTVDLDKHQAPGFVPVWRLNDDSSHLQVCNGVVFWPGDDGQEDLESVFAVLASESPIAESEFRTPLRHRALMQLAKATSLQAAYGDVPYLTGDVISSAGRGVEPNLHLQETDEVPQVARQAPIPSARQRAMRPHL